MADHPTTYAEAMAIAMEWASGKRSYHLTMIELAETSGQRGVTTEALTNVARADAAEVEKWCAVARALAAGELTKIARNPPVTFMLADVIDQLGS